MSNALHGLLLSSADRNPDRAAVVQGTRATTYGELAQSAARFAATLRRLGVSKGDRVAILIDGSAEYPMAYYGTAMAGAVAVPLSDDARARSLVSILAHSEARVVVIGGRNLGLLEGETDALPDLSAIVTLGPAPAWQDPRVVTLAFEEALASEDELRGGIASGDDPVAIQYTSGTTGEKKGVLLSHRNLTANAASIIEYLALSEDDVAGMVLPFYYVYGGSILHTHMAVGGTIALLGSIAFPIRVVEGLVEHRCTGFSGVPSTFARLLSLDRLRAHDLSALRYVTQAGAAMSREMAGRVRAALPGASLYIMYGQTEASARLAYLPPQDAERKAGSVGIPIPGVELDVLDGDGARCAPGVVGEVVARGANITRGYFRNPEATLRALRPNGLHTGDLGYLDEDGYLFLVGRETEMIKSGAHRIAPREIEEVIELDDQVAECAVVGKPDPLLGQAIVAFVVIRDGASLDSKDVLRRCRDELPRAKMPAEIRFVSELPRTQNGKLSRRVLAEQLAGGIPRV